MGTRGGRGPGNKCSHTYVQHAVGPQFVNPLININVGEYSALFLFLLLATRKAVAVNRHTQVFAWTKVFIFHW